MCSQRRRTDARGTFNAGQYADTANQLSVGQYARLNYEYEEEPVNRFAHWILQMVSLYF